MKYKAVIFDFDDTLVESKRAKWAQHKHVAKKFYNIDLSDEDIRPHWGKPIWELVSILYRNSDSMDNMRKALYSTRDGFRKKAFPGSADIFSKIIESGREVGVLSATTNFFLVEDLTAYGFPIDRLISIQGADDTTVHKPNGDVFIPMLEKLAEKGIKPKDVVYVGDSLDDFKAASGAGINFIALTTGLYTKEEFEQAGAKVILSDIRELMNLFT